MKFRLKAASGPHTGQAFELSEQTAIGSDQAAQIRIEGLGQMHAQIIFDGQVLTLEASESTYVNGEPVTRRALKSGDELRFGEHRFVLQAPGLRPPSVLGQVEQRRVNPWTWVVIGAVALSGLAAVGVFVLTRLT
jgi:hypothetical protein